MLKEISNHFGSHGEHARVVLDEKRGYYYVEVWNDSLDHWETEGPFYTANAAEDHAEDMVTG